MYLMENCSFTIDLLESQIKSVPTKPIEGQKTGTSGLRKKVFFSFSFLFIQII